MTTVGASSDGDGLAYRDVDDLGSVGPSSGKRSCLYNYLSCLLWPSPSSTKGKSWWMRFLLEEHWTDGSLIALKVDIFSGLTLAVAQVAPSIAFALMGHGPPLTGLFSSFFLGMICCLFGGRPGQITAIAGAVVVLYPNLVDKHGYGAVCAVSVIAGAMIVLPGVFRIARLVRLLPSALMVGFCNGLALSMVKNEIHSFKDAQGHYIQGKQALNTSIICIVSFAIMMLMPYFTKMVPAAFTAIVVGTAMEYIFHMNTITIGELYELHGDFPRPQVPDMDWSNSDAMKEVMLYSFLTAVISCIESFMSGYKIQQLTETPTNFERESIALGVAHIVNGFFQGMPGCVVFGPCILNLECGSGTRRLSSFICALLMVIIPVALYFVIGIIPMGALSAVVFGVSSKTADWRMLAMILLRRISLQESVVALVVTVVTVFTDLAVGAAAGFTAALLFFMWNMARGRVSMRPMENTAPFAMHPALPPAPPASRILSATNLDDDDEYPLRKRIISFEDSTSSTLTGDAPRRRRGAAGREDEGAAETATTTTASTTTHLRHVDIATAPITPMRSFAGPAITGVGAPAHTMEVNFLHIDVDPVFPDIKVLRVKLRGVLFFGSCVEFVDGMMDMLHTHHGEMFMKVTDLILDFQLGMMPVMDFSAAEAIQDAAKILLKRGIRTHTQNMDPMSWACFERCRRYFEDVVEDNVNNTKHVCYVRRMLNHSAHRKVCGGFGAESPSTSAGLDDDVFLRATNFLAEDGGGVEPTMDDATERVFTSTEVQLTFVETVKVGFPIYREAFGITVPVFDTVDGWVKRVEAATHTAQGNPLCWGLTPDPPFHRKFGDIGRLWFRRIPQLDVPAEGGPSIPHGTPPSFREPPTCFEQRPRFPGQGYAKAERLTRREWRSIKAYVCKRLFHSPPPPELGIVAARMQRFGKEVADGFV